MTGGHNLLLKSMVADHTSIPNTVHQPSIGFYSMVVEGKCAILAASSLGNFTIWKDILTVHKRNTYKMVGELNHLLGKCTFFPAARPSGS